MTAGAKRALVTIQKKIKSGGAAGGNTWTDLGQAWCAIVPIRARERREAMSVDHSISHTLEFWYDDLPASVRPDVHRIVDGARNFLPIELPIDPDERRREIHIVCREG